MKKTIVWVSVALVVALVAWRALHHNWPDVPGEGWPVKHSFRGHTPQQKVDENLSAAPGEGSYPPRALGLHVQRKPPSDSWLLDADSDRDRFRRLEVVLGGADTSMLEIGTRFGVLHGAVAAGDFALASFEMDRIVHAADVALLRQPGFREGAGLDYLGKTAWSSLREAVNAGDQGAAKAGFLGVRQACVACHTAEGKQFLNKLEVFEKTERFTEAAALAPPHP
jgi:hypothetical protein